jgi:hypothetical protein
MLRDRPCARPAGDGGRGLWGHHTYLVQTRPVPGLIQLERPFVFQALAYGMRRCGSTPFLPRLVRPRRDHRYRHRRTPGSALPPYTPPESRPPNARARRDAFPASIGASAGAYVADDPQRLPHW